MSEVEQLKDKCRQTEAVLKRTRAELDKESEDHGIVLADALRLRDEVERLENVVLARSTIEACLRVTGQRLKARVEMLEGALEKEHDAQEEKGK